MHIGIVGATGTVGRMMIRLLDEQQVSIDNLELFASPRSTGTQLEYRGKSISVQPLTAEAMQKEYDFLLFSPGGETSRKFSPIAQKAGNTIIDNSSAFRKDPVIPLVVPEINGHLLQNYRGIIANPNCSTIQLVLALHPLAREFGLKKVIVTTFQSVSGAGNKGIQELLAQREGSPEHRVFTRRIDMNVIPQIGAFSEDGYCEEELKMHSEICKILGNDSIQVSAETVRVPVLYGHSESVYIECEKPVSPVVALDILETSPGLSVLREDFFTPAEIGDSDKSFICRVRKGLDDNSLRFWNVGHNVRLGAATNAVRILKHIIYLANSVK